MFAGFAESSFQFDTHASSGMYDKAIYSFILFVIDRRQIL